MTVAAGFVCKNGIVLCADTEITAGTGKYQQSKIVHLFSACYAVYAGDSPFVAEIVPRLREKIIAVKSVHRVGTDGGAEWKKCFREYYTKPRKEEKTFAYLLLTLWHPDRIKLFSALANNFCLLSRICGLILAPEAVPACDKARFPWLCRCGSRRNVW